MSDAAGGITLPVATLHQNPDFDWDADGGDIGLLRLAEAADVMPVAFNAEPMTDDMIGQEAFFVGFGITSADRDDAGIKRSVSIEIVEIHEDLPEPEAQPEEQDWPDDGELADGRGIGDGSDDPPAGAGGDVQGPNGDRVDALTDGRRERSSGCATAATVDTSSLLGALLRR